MGRNWAITIGVNDYYNLQPLRYAVRDATAMGDLFRQELGFEQVYHFAVGAPPIPQDYGPPIDPAPTYTTLRRFLRTRFEQPFLQDGDNLWFFFAGHGLRHENRDYLLPMDGDRADLENSAIPLHYITERLRQSGADNIILLIDACRTLAGQRDGWGIGQEQQQGVITLFSCSPAESAYEIEELQQGAFTHVLLEGLGRQGEGNCATVERLYQQLRYDVPRLTQRYRQVSQTPYGMVEPPTKNQLILLPRQATLADVDALKKVALTAEVAGQPQQARQYWVRVLAVSPADLEAISGIERLSRGGQPPPPPRPAPTTTSPIARDATPAPVTPPQAPLPGDVLALKADAQNAELEGDLDLAEQLWLRVLAVSSADANAVAALKRIAIKQANLPTSGPNPGQPSVDSRQSLSRFSFEVVTVNPQGQIVDRKQASAPYQTVDLGQGVTLEMVVIPGGSFMMGQTEAEKAELIRQVGEEKYKEWFARELPQHQVTLAAFSLGKYPVTQAQYQAIMGNNPANFKGDKRPVEQVTWHEAMEFCDRLSKKLGQPYTLPSEAQWEYACRAGTTTPFHFGETITTDLANYRGSDWEYEGKTYPGFYGQGPRGAFREQTTDVGIFPPNGFGLYDLHGNVWEWCLDHWHDNYGGWFRTAPTDGSAWVTGGDSNRRMIRGGSWYNSPWYCRCACRVNNIPDNRFISNGFRVVSVPPRALG